MIMIMKMARDLKMIKNPSGPKAELIEAMKPFCQFNTCHEFKMLVDNLCMEKELKVRISELQKYRDHGLVRAEHTVQFEKIRYFGGVWMKSC